MKGGFTLICILLLWTTSFGSSYSDWRFDLLTQYDGLSSNQINSIVQDNNGYIWVGTGNGLDRYDGTTFDHFTVGNDQKHLKDAMIYALCVDGPYLWVGAFNKIQRLDTRTLTFKHFDITLGTSLITDIIKGPEGRIWIGSLEPGCWQFDEKADSIVKVPFPHNIQPSILGFNIDEDSTLWISTHSDGIFYFKKGSRKVQQLNIKNSATNTLLTRISSVLKFDSLLFISCHGNGLYRYNLINFELKSVDIVNKATSNTYYNKLVGDDYGNIWIAGDNSGLIKYDPLIQSVEIIQNSPNDQSSISSNSIRTIFFDHEKNLWVGTRNGGLNKSIKYSGKGFQYFNINDHGEFRGPISEITALFIRPNNSAWFGTDGQGLYYFSSSKKILMQVKLPEKFNVASIQSVFEDQNSNIYFGTYQYGFHLAKVKFENDRPIIYSVRKCKFVDADVRRIVPDGNGNLWLGTDGAGLILYNSEKGILEHYQSGQGHLNNSILANYINDFWIDPFKNIWVGFGSGISYINRQKKEIVNLTADNQTGITDFFVTAFECDKHGYLWLATHNGVFKSLNKINELDSLLAKSTIPDLSFKAYTVSNGLSNNMVSDILIDRGNNTWLATENGITYIDDQNEKILSYDKNDGLGGSIFNIRGADSSTNGNFYFTGKHGLSMINPQLIKYNTVPPETRFKNLQILSQSIVPGEEFNHRVVLENAINNTSRIAIKSNEKVFSLEFVTLSFVDPKNNIFRYRLHGFNEHWIYTTTKNNRCTYTNLNPGKYTLIVQGSNNDRVWSTDPAKIEIEIIPPFYKTSIFIVFSSMLLLIAIVLIQMRREKNQRKIKRKLKLLVDIRTTDLVAKNKEIAAQNEELEKANNLKNLFFNIIAHDLLNPVSALNQLMELIYSNYKTMSENERDVILKNATQSSQNTLDLIRDLLIWSRNQTNSLSFSFERINIFNLVSEVLINITPQSMQKSIEIINDIDPLATCFVDEPTVKLTFRNLLTNAIKFSHRNSKVIIGSKQIQNDYIRFHIQDFGVGITNEKIERLFRIYPNNSSVGTQGEQGTGLGLNLTYEFVVKNKGKIWVESKLGEGTVFYFTLPTTESTEINLKQVSPE